MCFIEIKLIKYPNNKNIGIIIKKLLNIFNRCSIKPTV